jgi:hypothetical protein
MNKYINIKLPPKQKLHEKSNSEINTKIITEVTPISQNVKNKIIIRHQH